MFLKFHKRTINYVDAMHSIFYYIGSKEKSTTNCLNGYMLWNDAVLVFILKTPKKMFNKTNNNIDWWLHCSELCDK